jgi:pimeloyl-ACP methyl ester carboxylesterase
MEWLTLNQLCTNMEHQITVGNRKLYAETIGSGHPSVVIEVGSTLAGTKDQGWWPIRDILVKETCVIMYDRAGTGDSDPTTLPRSISEFTTDLHAVINGTNVEKPYILLGGSFGGLIVTHYASLYPDGIAGIILEDSTHIEHNQRTLELLPVFVPGESQVLTNFRNSLWQEIHAPLSTNEEEGLDFPKSVAQMRKSWGLGNIPLIVLTAGQDEWEDGFPVDVAARYEQLWLFLQNELAARSTNSTHIVVRESGHCIHNDKPFAILNAIQTIRQVFNAGSTTG